MLGRVLFMIALFGVVFGVVGGVVVGVLGGVLFGVLFGVLGGVLVGVLESDNELNTLIKHWRLYRLLAQQGMLPPQRRDLVPFLDEAARRLLLQKVGGSYRFVHRILLDYFADLYEQESAAP